MAALVGKRRLPFRWRNNARETVCRRAIDFCRTQRHGRYSGTRGRSRKVTRRRRQSKVRNWRQSADGRRCLNHSQTSGRLILPVPASTAVLMASKIAAGPGTCLRTRSDTASLRDAGLPDWAKYRQLGYLLTLLAVKNDVLARFWSSC